MKCPLRLLSWGRAPGFHVAALRGAKGEALSWQGGGTQEPSYNDSKLKNSMLEILISCTVCFSPAQWLVRWMGWGGWGGRSASLELQAKLWG